jgi:hypothetical protein
VHVDLDTLATALYVRVDDEMKACPQLNRWRPVVGIAPRITDAELVTVSVMQALLGFHNERAVGSVMPESRSFICFRICPSSPGTTSGCGR